jgi:Uma2 family endonuclease
MAVTTSAPVHRLSIEDVYAMVRAEILDENARVELVEGVLVDLNPIGAEHADTTARLTKHFVVAVAEPLQVRVQDMLEISDVEYVLPDLAVIEPIDRHTLPRTALLVVEVSQTSRVRDREKVALYAALRVAEYWIVDLDAEVVTVHRGPSGPIPRDLGRLAFYRSIEEHRDGAVAPALRGVPPVGLDVLFGR